jgi:hypothetical protein
VSEADRPPNPIQVLLVDDNPATTAGSIHQLLRDGSTPERPEDRFVISQLRDPAGLDDYLDHHDPAVVVVDVDFELTGTGATCLTAFRTLFRRGAPYCIGLSTSEYGRTLFPFAVCQLLPQKEQQLVGWAYKDEDESRGYHRLIATLDLIRDEKRLPRPEHVPGLAKCVPNSSGSGSFMRRILRNPADVKLWSYLSTAHYDAEDLSRLASISTSSVYKYFGQYRPAIGDFQAAMADDTFHPSFAQASLQLSASSKIDPRQRIIEAFAQSHRRFFQATELEEIVKEYRTGRRINGSWLRPDRLRGFGRAARKHR